MLIGVFVSILSPILFFWTVPVEEEAFRKTGKIATVFVGKNSQLDVTVNPNDFGVDFGGGERLALRVSASGDMGIAVYYLSSGLLDVTLYPPTSGGVEDSRLVVRREPNVPMTVVLNHPGPANVKFTNNPSNVDINVTYELLVSFKVVKITHPYRESNAYLVFALLGTIIVLFGIYGFFAPKREPLLNRTSQDITQVSASKISYCRYCGAAVPQDSIFCKECGRRLKVT